MSRFVLCIFSIITCFQAMADLPQAGTYIGRDQNDKGCFITIAYTNEGSNIEFKTSYDNLLLEKKLSKAKSRKFINAYKRVSSSRAVNVKLYMNGPMIDSFEFEQLRRTSRKGGLRTHKKMDCRFNL